MVTNSDILFYTTFSVDSTLVFIYISLKFHKQRLEFSDKTEKGI